MLKTLAAISIVSILVSGCAEFGAIKSGVATHGANLADEALITGEWTICQAITVGAWKRAYGNDAEKAAAWRALCASGVKHTP